MLFRWYPPAIAIVLACLGLHFLAARAMRKQSASRLAALVAPVQVFSVRLDDGSRAVADAALADHDYLAVVGEIGLELWAIVPERSRSTVISWDRPRATETDLVSRSSTIALDFPDGSGIHLLVTGARATAAALHALIEEALNAQPDTSRTQSPARND